MDYTPMMQQYLQIKENNKDSIMFYRLGDFYEMFFEDAKVASKELELVLTGRDCGAAEKAPMCGIPYHSAEGYISRLVQKGYKVSICEQMEQATAGKGIVHRDIIRTISKGTLIEDSMLTDNKNNYICAVYMDTKGGGVCFCDMSTGEAQATQCVGSNVVQGILSELSRFSPTEAILSDDAYNDNKIMDLLKNQMNIAISNGGVRPFLYELAREVVEKQFDMEISEERTYAVMATGALLAHLHDTQKNDLTYINKLNLYTGDSFMALDCNAKRNLELVASLRSGEKKDTLLSVLDQTKTSMGGRLLKKWLVNPLLDVVQIAARHYAVKNLLEDVIIRDKLQEVFKEFYDIERIISRVSFGSANGRDLRALACVCQQLPQIKDTLMGMGSGLLKTLAEQIDPLQDMYDLINSAICESPPFSIREGGIICDGYHEQVDHLHSLMKNSNQTLDEIEQREREQSGIKTLKVGYNKVFGYYIELSKGASVGAPLHYVRKQTLANCERYITDELKMLEGEILSANDRAVALEYELFCHVRDEIGKNAQRFQRTANAVATCDVLCSFALAAAQNNYVCPTVTLSDKLEIIDGRHPVVEAALKSHIFVPNDTFLDTGDNRMAIITGPNMAGKSTYMKQTAIIVIMAQCGCFVPAKSANIGICDKIFTRVGASDDLAGGRSTFMVEMTEVADILKNATKHSLIILDEIGRGTSTYDGMAIARAVLEFVSNKKTLGAKTMFATHYHELTALENSLDGVKNYNIVVKKRGDDIIFINKIIPGGADDSYGVEVAKLAGLPKAVTLRAKEILIELEGENHKNEPKTWDVPEKPDDFGQITLTSTANDEIIQRLKGLSLDVMTPIESLNILNQLVGLAKKN